MFWVSTTMPLFSRMVYRRFTRSRYSAAFTASMWTMAWMLLPPLVTIAAMGRFSLRYILYCASRAIVSDSTSANLNAVTLELFTPSPLMGLNLIHAPASWS